MNNQKIQIVVFYFLSLAMLITGLLNVGLSQGAELTQNPIVVVITLIGFGGQVFYGFLIYGELKAQSTETELK